MVEALEIDPFDSNHWLYGTGETIYGGHNLKSWPNVHVSSLADGVEEESVQFLISPPGIGVPLISAVGDDGGFVHYNLDKPPANTFQNPYWSTTNALDYAGLSPKNVLRIGNSELATSSDAGLTWTLNSAAPSASGGTIAYSADASSIVWASSAGNLFISKNSSTTISSLPGSVSAVASDKVNPKYFYAGDTSGIYVSSNRGATFNATAKITSYASVRVKVNPGTAGDIWFSTDQGIYHSTDFGQTFTSSPGVQWAEDIAVGKGSGTTANVYAFNTINNVAALRKSPDNGATWSVISDAGHGFGSAGSNCLAASWETEGLVFVGTNGRGVFYGLP
jgi:xyloglucan-specific exo-beta-1,4-glucanase